MTSEDIGYYRGRIAAELDMARAASNPYARRAHQEMADNYVILCRLLCSFPIDVPQVPESVGDQVGFTTLIQTLTHPHGAELSQMNGGPADQALYAQPVLGETVRPQLDVPLIQHPLFRP